MWVDESRWSSERGWQGQATHRERPADLVIYFGNRNELRNETRYGELRAAHPAAKIVGCSATHWISGDASGGAGIAAVALGFEHTSIRVAKHEVAEIGVSRDAGNAIGTQLASPDLVAILVLADGLRVDGSDFLAGLNAAVGAATLIVGGMASDGREYVETLVGADGAPRSGMAAAVGFYGAAISFSYGLGSGWDAFGPQRRITRSLGNVLYALDDKSPFDLYRRYLADEFSPSDTSVRTILPLVISPPENPGRKLVRAPLALDEETGSITFAGHMPEGWHARLMRGNIDRLILAAGDAGRQARGGQGRPLAGDRLSFTVSCDGRQMMIGQRTDEELEIAGAELAGCVKRIGFYSYGEIAPAIRLGPSELHNQTIVVTSLFEAAA